MRMFVLLGSNIRPRHHLARAVAELREAFEVVAESAVYRTAPVGDTDQDDFWNLAVEIDSELGPEEVQAMLRTIERRLGRRRDPARPSGPRTADLDLVLIPGVKVQFGGLELPSPLLLREAFVAVPLADHEPGLPHPATGEPLRSIAAATSAAAARPPQPVARGLAP